MKSLFGLDPLVTGIILAVIVAVVILGGVKRIGTVTSYMVPFMSVFYILAGIAVIILRFTSLPSALMSIIRGAFNLQAVGGGVFGYAMMLAIRQGVARGVFSNEAGLGSAPIAHSASSTTEPCEQAMWGIFEVFADTIIVCTLTALTILGSGVIDLTTGEVAAATADVASSTYMSYAFSQVFGPVGSGFIALAILLFAYSTVLGWSHYGATACQYLFGDKSVLPYRIIFTIIVFLGSIMTAQLAWDISDTFNGLMMIPNLIGVLVLSPLVMKATKNYVDRKLHGKDEEPMLSMWPEIQKMQADAVKNAATEEDAE